MSGRLSDPATIVLCSITAILALSLAASILAKRTNLPPGPTKLPLIGNTLEVFRGKSMEELIAKWWKTYGPIVHVNIFGRNIVFINDLHMAQELTEKRGNIYSDRPTFVMFDLLGWNTVFTMPYGPQFRKHRRMMQTVLSEKAVDSFRHMQAKSAMLFVKLLVSDAAEDLQRHIKRYAAATMMKVAYDHDVDSLEDPIVKLSLEAATETLELGTVSTTIVDYIPALVHLPAWFPFAGFKRRAIVLRQKVETSQVLPYELVKKRMINGDSPDCFVSKNIHDCGGLDALSHQDERDIQGAAAALYTGAEETTLAVIHSFFLGMLLNPSVYRRAQKEIEEVIGSERLPDPDDRNSLPYLDAVLKELYRWTAPTSLNAPHRVKEDDIYMNYFIPKGTDVFVNNFGLLRGCPEPDKFIPERFLGASHLLGTVPSNPRDVIFGFGRRRCPGWHFADRSVWVAISHIIPLFDILPVIDENGREVIPSAEFGTSNVRHPKPFKCRVLPREDRKKLLERVLD